MKNLIQDTEGTTHEEVVENLKERGFKCFNIRAEAWEGLSLYLEEDPAQLKFIIWIDDISTHFYGKTWNDCLSQVPSNAKQFELFSKEEMKQCRQI